MSRKSKKQNKHSKKNKQVRMTVRRSRKQRTRVARPRVSLSNCALHYAAAVGRPFSVEARGACLPTFPARNSVKAAAVSRFTVVVGSTYGYFCFAPTIANDRPAVYYSNQDTYTGNNLEVSAVTGATASALSALPQPASYFIDGSTINSSTLSGRIVSAAIRFRYSGTELNKGGTATCLVSPDHESVATLNEASMYGYKDTFRVPCSRQWTTLCTSSVDSHECEYPDAGTWVNLAATGSDNVESIVMLYPYSQGVAVAAANPGHGAPIMGVLFSGTKGNTYEVEVIEHIEIVGKGQAYMTKSHSDIEGLSKITEVLGNTNSSMNSNPNFESNFSDKFIEMTNTVDSFVQGSNALLKTLLTGAATYQSLRAVNQAAGRLAYPD